MLRDRAPRRPRGAGRDWPYCTENAPLDKDLIMGVLPRGGVVPTCKLRSVVIPTSRAGKPDVNLVLRLGAKTGQQQGPPARPSRSESEQLPEPIGGRRADGVRFTQDRVCSEERRGRHGRTDLHRNRRCQGPPRCPRPPEWRGVAVGERPRRHRRTRGAGDDARPGAGRAGGVGEVRGPVCCGPRGGRGTCGRREPAAGPGLREVDRPARQDRHARRGHARALR